MIVGYTVPIPELVIGGFLLINRVKKVTPFLRWGSVLSSSSRYSKLEVQRLQTRSFKQRDYPIPFWYLLSISVRACEHLSSYFSLNIFPSQLSANSFILICYLPDEPRKKPGWLGYIGDETLRWTGRLCCRVACWCAEVYCTKYYHGCFSSNPSWRTGRN